MKFSQLIEHENHFSWKIMHKTWWRNYFQTLFYKFKIKFIFGSVAFSFVFIIYQVEDYRNILKLSCRQLAFTSYKAFLKSKTRSGTSILASLCARFLKKYVFLVILYYLNQFHCFVAFLSSYIGQYVYCNCLLTTLWHNKFLN